MRVLPSPRFASPSAGESRILTKQQEIERCPVNRRTILGAAFLTLGFPRWTRAETANAMAVVDDLGRSVVVREPVRRAVVFNRYNVEFVRAVAGTAAIVGVDQEVDKAKAYWPGLQARLVGQGQSSVNYEAIVALKPDVVVFARNGDWSPADEVLKPFSIPVVVITGWDVLKHESNVELVGRMFGQPERAGELNDFYRHYRDLLQTRLKNVKRPRVYMEEVKDYRTVLKGSGWHDMVELAGGENAFGDVNILGQPKARGNIQGFEVDPEEIVARRPEVIVKLEPNQYAPHSPAFSAKVLASVVDRPGFADLPAVRDGRLYHISYYLAGGCSKVIGALQLAKWLHPEQTHDVDSGAAMKTWLEHFQGVPYPAGYAFAFGQTPPSP